MAPAPSPAASAASSRSAASDGKASRSPKARSSQNNPDILPPHRLQGVVPRSERDRPRGDAARGWTRPVLRLTRRPAEREASQEAGGGAAQFHRALCPILPPRRRGPSKPLAPNPSRMPRPRQTASGRPQASFDVDPLASPRSGRSPNLHSRRFRACAPLAASKSSLPDAPLAGQWSRSLVLSLPAIAAERPDTGRAAEPDGPTSRRRHDKAQLERRSRRRASGSAAEFTRVRRSTGPVSRSRLALPLGPSVDMLADIVANLAFAASEIERLRGSTSHIASRDCEPQGIALRHISALLDGNQHPTESTSRLGKCAEGRRSPATTSSPRTRLGPAGQCKNLRSGDTTVAEIVAIARGGCGSWQGRRRPSARGPSLFDRHPRSAGPAHHFCRPARNRTAVADPRGEVTNVGRHRRSRRFGRGQ